MALEKFVQKTLDLLEKEKQAEIEENQFLSEKLSARELERKGVCLLNLQLKSCRTGLYGRIVAVFEPRLKPGRKEDKPELPSHNMTPGDNLGVSLMKSQSTDKPMATGIVSQVTRSNISVAFDESQGIFELDDEEHYKLTKMANDVTYRRLKQTLDDLFKYRSGPAQRLIDTFFNLSEVSGPSGEFPIRFVNESLDESQREAVRFALTQREVAIIHGPPGTGKTTTVVELIVQAVRRGMKVLATAPSNIAVDNLVERLASNKQRVVRIGHPARLLSHLQKYSLDAIVSASEEKGIVKDVRADMQAIMVKMKRARGHGERHALRDEMKQLRKEVNIREEAATREVLTRADVVLVTLSSASRDGPLKHLKEEHFDLVVIDECSQATEAACWIGLLHAPRCVLAGDHLQLPPTILSKEAAAEGLAVTLMERLLNMLVEEKGKDVMRMLTTQYRMNTDIMMWASQQLYQGRLEAHDSVAKHLLSDLEDVESCEETSTPLLLIDTAGCQLEELSLPNEVSKGNEGEADIVAAHVEDLIQFGVRPKDIAVIAPYNLQVELLRVRLSSQYPDLEIKSVDGFQGREKEAVVISMVRSNISGEVGFLADKRRINVAITRARRHLAVVCDSETVSHDPFIKSLIDYMGDTGDVVSAQQYISDGRVISTSIRSMQVTDMVDNQSPKKSRTNTSAGKCRQNPVKDLKTIEQKSQEYGQVLNKFMIDENQSVIHFPSSLNSHDRMVIHELAQNLGLNHTSTGTGKERQLLVTKIGAEMHTMTGLSSQDVTITNNLSSMGSRGDADRPASTVSLSEADQESENILPVSDLPQQLECQVIPNLPEEDSPSSQIKKLSKDADAMVIDVSCNSTKEEAKCDNDMIQVCETGDASIVGGEEEKKGEVTENQSLDCLGITCQLCQKKILPVNALLHNLHCSKQQDGCMVRPVVKPGGHTDTVGPGGGGSGGGGGVRKKATGPKEKKKKGKLQETHVQKAADIFKDIDDDDFDSLISSIMKHDNKCSYKGCKTLTTTLGRNCEFCTRCFCLTHLMPEVHGCGDAAKVEARRIISRDGVLHRGSGVPNRKPNEARRDHLESKLEKKLGDLANKRKGKQEKRKS